MAKLKRVGVLFLAKLLAVVMAWVGLLAGIVYSFGGFIYELFTASLNFGTVLAFMALIGMPVIFSACGFAAGVIAAVIYNTTARWIRGIELDIDVE